MGDAQNLDRLVDEITRRVRDRLDGATAHKATAPAARAATGQGCDKIGPSECDACRGCHVNKPDDVRAMIKLGADRLAAGMGHLPPAADIAPYIDHTLLKPEATRDELKKLCDEARRYGFATVCVNSVNVRFCKALLEGATTKVIAVVGFPLGAMLPAAKAFEAREAVRNGAEEIDMVLNIGALKSKDYGTVLEDIRAVVQASAPKPVKVILETGMLAHDEKVIGCALSRVGGAAFVKTSTGFGQGGATVEDIQLMRAIVGAEMGVKASGGVRTEEDARKMLAAGANRLGASASVAIVMGQSKAEKKLAAGKKAAGAY